MTMHMRTQSEVEMEIPATSETKPGRVVAIRRLLSDSQTHPNYTDIKDALICTWNFKNKKQQQILSRYAVVMGSECMTSSYH
jgi:hypothetical protein